jgi:hypothetical protein
MKLLYKTMLSWQAGHFTVVAIATSISLTLKFDT